MLFLASFSPFSTSLFAAKLEEARSSFTFQQSDLPKLDLQVDQGKDSAE